MAQKLPSDGQILGVDFGQKRTGLALASPIAKLPRPHSVVDSSGAIDKIKELISTEEIGLIIVGLPRSLEGEETAQSKSIRQFADELSEAIKLPIRFADETLSSIRAKQYIADHKLPQSDVDSIAACFILEEFLGGAGNQKES